MLGPFSLRYVHLFVGEGSTGAFILSRNGRTADRVGHSANDLANAIRAYRSRSGYRYFWFSYADSQNEAANLSNYWCHRYRPSDNSPPEEGAGPSTWECTEAGCTACALAKHGVP